MPVERGRDWGQVVDAAPPDALDVTSDAAAAAAVTEARRARRPVPDLVLRGGDLWRTLGGPGTGRARFQVDLGAALVDGRLHWFVAHLVARNRTWTQAFVAMNAQWLGRWDVAPQSHPGDGVLDTYDAQLRLGDLPKVRSRIAQGAHLPHPRITSSRAPSTQVDFHRPRRVYLDGTAIGAARAISVRTEPAALTVYV